MSRFGSAVILSGGKSRRMGFDKSKIKIEGQQLVEIIGDKLQDIFKEIILVTNEEGKFNNLQYKVLVDEKKDLGPAGGIYTGIKEASSEYVFIIACDMPVINNDYIRYMMDTINKFNPEGVVSKKGEWIEPLYSFYSKSMIRSFERGIDNNNLKLFEIIKECNILYIDEATVRKYSGNLDIFTNLNYACDLNILKKIFGKEADINGYY